MSSNMNELPENASQTVALAVGFGRRMIVRPCGQFRHGGCRYCQHHEVTTAAKALKA